jgi:hypothetical protein
MLAVCIRNLMVQIGGNAKMPTKNPHAVALGRKGGLASKGKTSTKKQASSRANIAKAREARRKILNRFLADQVAFDHSAKPFWSPVDPGAS